jgi:kynurenine 3-monooxygenase
MKNSDVTIIGAGLSGPLMASYLSKQGYVVDLFERRPDMRKNLDKSGRSINLALSQRGIRALKDIGLFDSIKRKLIAMKGRMIHNLDGGLSLQPYGTSKKEVIYSISRSFLNISLLNHVDLEPNISVSFDHQLNKVNFEKQQLSFGNKKVDYKKLIGADGFNSQLRKCIMEKTELGFVSKQLGHGYKELTIPQTNSGDYLMDPSSLHIWPRGNFMLIALPNTDKTFTCTLFAPLKGKNSFAKINTKEDIITFFRNEFPDTIDLIPNLTEDFKNNPTGKLSSIYCNKWNYKDAAIIMGDAAHAIVPFFGQGMNASFQDCTVINGLISLHEKNLGTVFKDFGRNHVRNGHAIANMALENYVEMRDLVNDEDYKKYRKMELNLEKKFPDRFIPRYSMVSFNEMSYSKVYERGKIQSKIIKDFISGKISKIERDKMILDKLEPQIF